MDILTPVLCVALPGLAATLYYAVTAGSRKRAEDQRIANVKSRADARAAERQFADTEPENDPYRSSVDFQTAMHAVEVDDRYDGRGDLTDAQSSTISLIFDGFKPSTLQAPKNLSGGSAHARAGVPWAQSIFGEDNQLVGPEDKWLNNV